MVVKKFENAGFFLRDYEKLLLEKEAVSQLILYNAYQKLEVTACESCLFGAVLDEEKVQLLFCNVAPYNLTIFTPLSDSDREGITSASEELARYVCDNHISFIGINGRYQICQSFIERYRQLIKCTFLEKLGMDIMEIRKVNDIKPVDGVQRLARPDEVKLITDWMIEFQIEALASETDYEAALAKVNAYTNEGKIYVFENMEHTVVSMAIATRKLVHGMAISYVFTPEEYRGKGYAAANIYYLSKELLEKGYEFCTLFVDKRNPISNRAYEKVGYITLEETYEYKLILQEE